VDRKCADTIPGADWSLSFNEWKALLARLQECSEKTWAEVLREMATGSGRNHFQDTDTVAPAVAGQIPAGGGEVFRLRINSRARLWGYCSRDIFYPMVYDRDHKVYTPVK
jgi:hypothetical protein